MAEEVRDAAVVVPRAIMNTFYINASLGLVMLITIIYSIPSIEDSISHPSGYAFIYILEMGVPSSGIVAIIAILIALITANCLSNQASTARTTFAFARDEGLPFSKWIAHVNPRTRMPVNAILLSSAITIALNALYLGSSTAFDAMVTPPFRFLPLWLQLILTAFPLRLRTTLQLHPRHRLLRLPPPQETRINQERAMGSRTLGTADQHRSYRVHHICDILDLLARLGPGEPRGYELGVSYLCRSGCAVRGILLHHGEGCLQGAGGVYKGSLDVVRKRKTSHSCIGCDETALLLPRDHDR